MTTHSYVALDYTAELHEWAAGKHESDVRVVQLPYSQVSNVVTDCQLLGWQVLQ